MTLLLREELWRQTPRIPLMLNVGTGDAGRIPPLIGQVQRWSLLRPAGPFEVG